MSPLEALLVAFTLAAALLLLAVIHSALGLVWFAALILATRPLVRALRTARVVRTLDRLTGGLLLLFGARLALSRA
jgi:threonine/homoserine/homoserine lactone efflux protein